MIQDLPFSINNYTLTEELMHFDNCGYYKATYVNSNNQNFYYVVKVLSKSAYKNRIRYSNEIYALCKFNHPNIAKIYGHFEDKLFYFLVHQTWSHSLLTFLRNKGNSDRQVLKFLFEQITAAIAYCHSLGFVHCNINLNTIVIDDYSKVFLIGFDYSELLSTFVQDNEITTPLEFTPPEMLMDINRKPTFSMDIYSLGVLFFYILVKQFPWPEKRRKRYKWIQNGRYLIPTNTEPAISFIIRNMIVVNPAARKNIDEVMEYFSNYFSQFDSEPPQKVQEIVSFPSLSPKSMLLPPLNHFSDGQFHRKTTKDCTNFKRKKSFIKPFKSNPILCEPFVQPTVKLVNSEFL